MGTVIRQRPRPQPKPEEENKMFGLRKNKRKYKVSEFSKRKKDMFGRTHVYHDSTGEWLLWSSIYMNTLDSSGNTCVKLDSEIESISLSSNSGGTSHYDSYSGCSSSDSGSYSSSYSSSDSGSCGGGE